MARGAQFNPDHTRVIVRCYERMQSTRDVATHLRISRGKVIRHLRHANVSVRDAGRPTSRLGD